MEFEKLYEALAPFCPRPQGKEIDRLLYDAMKHSAFALYSLSAIIHEVKCMPFLIDSCNSAFVQEHPIGLAIAALLPRFKHTITGYWPLDLKTLRELYYLRGISDDNLPY